MSLLPGRLALALLCALPAVSWNFGTVDRPLLATFMYACDASNPQPRVTLNYTAGGRPAPKPDTTPIELYEKGKGPDRAFEPIGHVQVLASSSHMSESELDDWARRSARKLGGDALVEMRYDDAAHMEPKAGPVGLLCLTADVVRWR